MCAAAQRTLIYAFKYPPAAQRRASTSHRPKPNQLVLPAARKRGLTSRLNRRARLISGLALCGSSWSHFTPALSEEPRTQVQSEGAPLD